MYVRHLIPASMVASAVKTEMPPSRALSKRRASGRPVWRDWAENLALGAAALLLVGGIIVFRTWVFWPAHLT